LINGKDESFLILYNSRERKWKEKIKEWGYSKKLSEDDMKVVVAKVAHRSRQGKRTVVSHAGSTIAKERLRNFVRRKTVKSSQAMSPSACEILHTTLSFIPA
jgi:hypothetical protein